MRAKVNGVFIGRVENSFVNKEGEEIEYKQISVNIPGEMENNVIKVPRDLDFSSLVPYQPCFLLLNFAYDSKYRNYSARLVKICDTAEELADIDPYFDDAEKNGYLASMGAAAKTRRNS